MDAMLGRCGAVDHQHIGPVGGQVAPGHRAGQDAGEVEHAHAVQRALCGVQRRQWKGLGGCRGGGVIQPPQCHHGLGAQRGGLGVGVPVAEGSGGGHGQAGLGGSGLEVFGAP